jgi:transcriptional regulator with XRE-family HTH domain
MASGRHPDLARRQRVLQLKAQGLSGPQIARRLRVTPQAVWYLLQAIQNPKVLSLPCRRCRASIVSSAILQRDRGKALCLACLSSAPRTSLAIRLVSLRLARQMTIGEVARRAGVVYGTVRRIEIGVGKPYRRTVDKLAKVLGAELILPLE